MMAKRKQAPHPLDIPDFLRIPQKMRDREWELSPPSAVSFELPTTVKNEDDATRQFREQLEKEKELKKQAQFSKMKRKKELAKVDRTGQRWNSMKNRWEDDPWLMQQAERERQERLANSGLVLDRPEPKVKARKPEKPKAEKSRTAKAPRTKSGPVVRPCSDKVTALPEKGKRREVALACHKDWTSIAAIAMRLDCSEGSVRSHLTDLHAKHGFGYELDAGRCRLITPKGWKP